MRNKSLMLAAVVAAASLPAFGAGAEVVHRDFGAEPRGRDPRASAFRQGRRFRETERKVGNPAGTKLARKAAQGKLTIVGIR